MDSLKTSFVCGSVTVHIEGSAGDVRRLLNQDALAERVVRAITPSEARSEADTDILELSLEHARQWFTLHADHRMRSIYFFLASVAFLSAAYVTALRFSHPIAALGITVAGLLLTICFSRLELRIRELLKAGEAALSPLEAKLAALAQIPAIKIVESVEASRHCFVKYSTVVNTLHLVIALTFAGGFLLAFLTYKGLT